jgi:SAM-dependent methyltransferase
MKDDDWTALAPWWIVEVQTDPIYELDVLPLALDLLGETSGLVLDLGCGEGQLMRELEDRPVVGCDISLPLLEHAAASGPVVRCRLPSLAWLADGVVDTTVSVLVLELFADLRPILDEVRRVTRRGGHFAIVVNHPAYTAEGSGPVVDLTDGEVLWRWGPYFEPGSSQEAAGDAAVTFHHRTLAEILSTAAETGWRLERIVEHRLTASAMAKLPWLKGHESFPLFLGALWSAD